MKVYGAKDNNGLFVQLLKNISRQTYERNERMYVISTLFPYADVRASVKIKNW